MVPFYVHIHASRGWTPIEFEREIVQTDLMWRQPRRNKKESVLAASIIFNFEHV